MKHLISLVFLLFASSTQAAFMFTYIGNAADIGGGANEARTDAGAATDAQVEAFLGLAAGSLDGLSPSGNDATEGSAVKAVIDVEAGDTVSFDWIFATDEDPNDPVCPADVCRDFAFFNVSGPLFGGLFLLADALDDNAGANSSVMLVASGAGTLEIGIGVMDVNDILVVSSIIASNFVCDPVNPLTGCGVPQGPGPGPGPGPGVPAPMTLALFGLGLVSIGATRRRKTA